MRGERAERRLAAVLAADVVGYRSLMGNDEEGTLARLKAVRKALVDPTIAAYRGRISRFFEPLRKCSKFTGRSRDAHP